MSESEKYNLDDCFLLLSSQSFNCIQTSGAKFEEMQAKKRDAQANLDSLKLHGGKNPAKVEKKEVKEAVSDGSAEGKSNKASKDSADDKSKDSDADDKSKDTDDNADDHSKDSDDDADDKSKDSDDADNKSKDSDDNADENDGLKDKSSHDESAGEEIYQKSEKEINQTRAEKKMNKAQKFVGFGRDSKANADSSYDDDS